MLLRRQAPGLGSESVRGFLVWLKVGISLWLPGLPGWGLVWGLVFGVKVQEAAVYAIINLHLL